MFMLLRVLVSELSGQSNILSKVEDSGMASKAELKASNVWRDRLGQVRLGACGNASSEIAISVRVRQ